MSDACISSTPHPLDTIQHVRSNRYASATEQNELFKLEKIFHPIFKSPLQCLYMYTYIQILLDILTKGHTDKTVDYFALMLLVIHFIMTF